MIGELQAQKPELVVHIGHIDEINAVAFSPNGQYILTGSNDRTAKLWDLRGRELQSFVGHASRVTSVAFSPDNLYVLTGSGDSTAKLWDLQGRELHSFKHCCNLRSIAFSHDGQGILIGGDNETVKLWNITDQEFQSFRGYRSRIASVTFSPDGKQILSGSRAGTVKLWDLRRGRERHTFIVDISGISSVSISPDGRKILTGSAFSDKTAKLWNRKGQELQRFTGHKGRVTTVAFSPDGQKIFTGSSDSTAKLWDVNGTLLQSFSGHTDLVRDVVFSPDGNSILTVNGDSTATLWDLSSKEISSIEGHSAWITSLAFSPNGKQILIGSRDFTAKLWDFSKGKLQSFKGHREDIQSVAFSLDGQYILSGSWDSTAKMWNLGGEELQSFVGHTSWVSSVAFSPDGENIVTASSPFNEKEPGEVKLWSRNGRELRNFIGHTSWVSAITFSPDGRRVLTSSGDKTAKLWNLNGKLLRSYIGHAYWVNAVAFSPDGQQILTGSCDHTVKRWNLNGRTLETFHGHRDCINSVTFSPDGKQILTGSSDSTAILWDLKGNELQRFVGHTNEIWSVAFSPDGQYILTGSSDQTAKMWDASTGENLLTFFSFSDKDDSWVISDPDQFYMASKKGINFMHFNIGLAAFNFDQFDLRLNRPDKILERLLPLGIDSGLVVQYRNAYYKRLEKYGFTEDMLADDYHVPECIIPNSHTIPVATKDSMIRLQIVATDTLRLLDRLNVYVNDVPIYGITGINIRQLSTQTYSTQLDIPLSQGKNKIEVSALNQGGAESMKATTYISYETPEVKPDLYLVTIGVSDYQGEGKDLTYAAKDARDIANFYAHATGFKQVYPRTLTNEQVTKSNILALRNLLEQSQVDDQVLIYVSGHGLLDENYDFYFATHDIDFDQPASTGILYDEIEGLLDGIPARKKLLLMDACHSGEYDADAQAMTQAQQDSLKAKGIAFKGFSKSGDGPILGLQNSFEMMKQLFADLRRGSGATVISSSSGLQFSYEDPNWQNGAFTYVFLRGLKTLEADENKDGQVTASEIQTYVAEFVPRLTEGLQVPTFRRENLENDFRVW